MTINVYLDGDIDHAIPLHAYRIDGAWNGFPVPVVTEAEFRRFIAALAADDDTWSTSTVETCAHSLYHSDENATDVWQSVGTDEDNALLYALSGWTWSL